MMILPKIASSSKSSVVADIKLGFIGMGQQSMFYLTGFSDTRDKSYCRMRCFMELNEKDLKSVSQISTQKPVRKQKLILMKISGSFKQNRY